MRVLVVEDEPKISKTISEALADAGYVPECAFDGEKAWFLGSTETYVAAILDIGLPKLDGLSVLRNWRKEGNSMPVLLLTAKGSWPERVEGIDAGADDYLVKPFQMAELLARLRALVRRSSGHSKSTLTIGSLSLDTRQMRVEEDGVQVKLTPLEYRLLAYLAHNPGRVVSQEELASNIYFQDQEPNSNAVEVTVGRLRRKLKSNIIQNRRGFGYILDDAGA